MNFLKFKKPKTLELLVALHMVVLVFSLVVLIIQKGDPKPSSEKIVVIPVEGVISMTPGSLNRGQTVSGIVKTLNQLRDKKDVKAVVLKINSPGGSVGAVQEIYRALQKLRKNGKFIVSTFGDVAASGGYYIACAGDAIVSNPGSLTGSIGVIMQLPSVQDLFGKIGLSMRVIKSGKMKDSGSPFRNMKESERRYFQAVIDDGYDQFYEAVKTGRKLEDKEMVKVADGRIFTGKMALDKKLVDKLGGLEDAIEKAKELAGITEKPQIIYKKSKRSLERLMGLISKSPIDSLQPFTDNQIKLMYLLQ